MTEMMKALVYEKPGRENASIKEIPIPACDNDSVLMKVMSCGICKFAEISHDRDGSLLGVYPSVPGHEFSGVAVKVGKNVRHVKVGDRITADNGVQCGTCYYCLNGMPSMCENYTCQGHNLQGAFAQYICCKGKKTYTFSDRISFDAASLCELLNCTMSGVDNADLNYGDNVAVFGCGSSGNLLAQLFKNSCAGSVVALDSVQEKLDRLSGLGIKTVLVDRNNYELHEAVLKEMFPHGIDVIVDAAGDDKELFERSLYLLAPFGRYVAYSFFYNEPKVIMVPPGLLIRKGLRIVSAPLRMYHWQDCIDALENGKINPDSVITDTYQLSKYFEALDKVIDDNQNTLKVVIHPND